MVNPTTIRIVLALEVSYNLPLHQLDVSNAFLHGHLNEECLWNNLMDSLINHILIMYVDSKRPSMASNKLFKLGSQYYPKLFTILVLRNLKLITLFSHITLTPSMSLY